MQLTDRQAPDRSAQDNIDAVVRLEESAKNRRTLADKISDRVAGFVGSMSFVLIHVVWFVVWVGLKQSVWRFDPYPFSLLCMLVSLEAVLLSTFVLSYKG